MMSQHEPRQPEEEIRVGGTITTSIWRHETQRGDRTVVNYNVQLQKRYFDKADQTWKTSTTFFPDELPRAQLALQRAYEYIMIQSNNDAGDSASAAR